MWVEAVVASRLDPKIVQAVNLSVILHKVDCLVSQRLDTHPQDRVLRSCSKDVCMWECVEVVEARSERFRRGACSREYPVVELLEDQVYTNGDEGI